MWALPVSLPSINIKLFGFLVITAWAWVCLAKWKAEWVVFTFICKNAYCICLLSFSVWRKISYLWSYQSSWTANAADLPTPGIHQSSHYWNWIPAPIQRTTDGLAVREPSWLLPGQDPDSQVSIWWESLELFEGRMTVVKHRGQFFYSPEMECVHYGPL